MEAVRPASRSASHDRNLNGTHATRPRVAGDRDPICNGLSSRGTNEDRSPSTLPKAFQGMLKTTTETGDIGMFSIKPSRIPQAVSTPRRTGRTYHENARKPQQSFQPSGVPGVDDRRRLPSYARDAASEVISMYETASQKSGNRGYEDPVYRSFSMTQTSSYSSYTLSNHRSYASLRSQSDGNGLLQRPRSPFAYPTRLKRPGFRPSSPALTDGGIIDYSRRAEIERIQFAPGHSTSSPSSLYAQKRKPPLSLRNEANRSTPSLLSQPSPPRRSPSPNIRQSTGNQGIDWSRRNTSTSVNTSPARSTFSLASTINVYATAAPASTTTTPGKFHPPSPLYYDYTEDFDTDVAPPPAFRIDKSIPEHRPMSGGRPVPTIVDERSSDASLKSRLRNASSVASIHQKSFEESIVSSKRIQDPNNSVAFPLIIESIPAESQLGVTAVDSKRDTKVIRLSGLGYGARELSTHVEEAFGLPSSSSFEINIPGNSQYAVGKATGAEILDRPQKEVNTQSARSSGYSLSTNLNQFPQPPNYQPPNYQPPPSISEDAGVGHLQDGVGAGTKSSGPEGLSQQLQPSQTFLKQGKVDVNESKKITLKAQGNIQRYRSSAFNTVGTGWTELSELITSLESNNRPRSPDKASDVLTRRMLTSPTLPNEVSLPKAYPDHGTNFPQALVNHVGPDPNHSLDIGQLHSRSQHRHRAPTVDQAPLLAEFSAANLPNLSHQIPRQLASRSESPMLAPKPISPARQLRLKNSVPQLMKALPPLPPDPPTRAVSPPNHLTSFDTELPCQFSPLLPASRSILNQNAQGTGQFSAVDEVAQKALPKKPEGLAKPDLMPKESIAKRRELLEKKAGSPPPVQRLKLKGRNTGKARSLSPPDSRPWNLEESYPWSSQNPNVELPSLAVEDQPENPKPKFKLKITRATNSTQGTIRINRDSVESTPLAGLHLRNPKDLFTPTPRLDNIFRQVSRHLHSRRSSVHSIHQSSTESSSSPISTSISNQISENATTSEAITMPGFRSTLGIRLTPSEAHSLSSDDSSHSRGRNMLRTRLSNLKSRMAVPYTTRVATHSYDDINGNDRSTPEAPPPSALRSVPNLHSARIANDGGPLRGLADRVHGQKLREKVRGWLKEARSAFAARMKSRNAAGKSDDERAQLTPVV